MASILNCTELTSLYLGINCTMAMQNMGTVCSTNLALKTVINIFYINIVHQCSVAIFYQDMLLIHCFFLLYKLGVNRILRKISGLQILRC